MKRGLLRELGARLRSLGGSHEIIGRRFRLARPEITAIMSGNASRFTLERILKLLRRCGCDINVDLAAVGRGGMVRWERLSDLGLDWLPITNKTGLTLIGGDDENVRRNVLTGILREHAARGDRTVLYCQAASSEDLATVRFQGDRDIQKLISYQSDIDIPQRERLGASVSGIDSIPALGASPWTAMHFARGMRVYATLESMNGPSEAQRVVDEFVNLMGPPHIVGNWERVHEVVDTVIVPRPCYPARDQVIRYVATSARTHPNDPIVEVITGGQGLEDKLVAQGLAYPTDFDARSGPLRTFDDAYAFLRNLLTHFDSEFDITGPEVHSKKELEIIVRHRKCAASVSIAASWSSVKERYGIVFTTDEPECDPAGRTPPVTSLGVAPTDASYLVRRTTSFLTQFDVGDSRASASGFHLQ